MKAAAKEVLGRHRRKAAKLVRYAGVSAVSTTISLTVLGALVATRTLSPGWANLVATGIGTVPSFELNRRWVWCKRGRRSLGREVLPFWALSLGGLGLSTWAVSVAARTASSAGWGDTAVALTSQVANVATFGSLWVLQYHLLDRVLFARSVPTFGGDEATVCDRPAPGPRSTPPAGDVSHDRVRVEELAATAGR